MEIKYTQKWLGMGCRPTSRLVNWMGCSASREYCSVLLNLEMKKGIPSSVRKEITYKSLEQLGIL